MPEWPSLSCRDDQKKMWVFPELVVNDIKWCLFMFFLEQEHIFSFSRGFPYPPQTKRDSTHNSPQKRNCNRNTKDNSIVVLDIQNKCWTVFFCLTPPKYTNETPFTSGGMTGCLGCSSNSPDFLLCPHGLRPPLLAWSKWSPKQRSRCHGGLTGGPRRRLGGGESKISVGCFFFVWGF